MIAPLKGVKVVEVAMWAFVPSTGAMLSDMGADVIKIEPPTGDPCRALSTAGIGPGANGFTAQWETYNRGKRSITLDLRLGGSQDVLHKLLEDADVFLTSLLPAARRQMKIDIDDIRKLNPNIIYAIGSGTGLHGAEAEKGGFDLLSFWSRGGVCASVSAPEAAYPASMPSGAFGDCIAGAMLACGINAALYQRATTRHAPVVDGTLLASSMWAMQSKLTTIALLGMDDLPKRPRSQANNPLVNFFRTKDDRFLTLSMLQSQRYWSGFCKAIGRPDLIGDPRFATDSARMENIDACVSLLDDVFAERDLAEWEAALFTQDGQWDVVRTPGEVTRDPQVVANRYTQDVEYDDGRKLKMISVPVQFDQEALPARPAPELGADSDAILSRLGYSEQDIVDLKISGVVF
jgi:crotonobetainyl-CoA:carnitine CoA-transferase CaiB-like acyl-CoA transferase